MTNEPFFTENDCILVVAPERNFYNACGSICGSSWLESEGRWSYTVEFSKGQSHAFYQEELKKLNRVKDDIDQKQKQGQLATVLLLKMWKKDLDEACRSFDLLINIFDAKKAIFFALAASYVIRELLNIEPPDFSKCQDDDAIARTCLQMLCEHFLQNPAAVMGEFDNLVTNAREEDLSRLSRLISRSRSIFDESLFLGQSPLPARWVAPLQGTGAFDPEQITPARLHWLLERLSQTPTLIIGILEKMAPSLFSCRWELWGKAICRLPEGKIFLRAASCFLNKLSSHGSVVNTARMVAALPACYWQISEKVLDAGQQTLGIQFLLLPVNIFLEETQLTMHRKTIEDFFEKLLPQLSKEESLFCFLQICCVASRLLFADGEYYASRVCRVLVWNSESVVPNKYREMNKLLLHVSKTLLEEKKMELKEVVSELTTIADAIGMFVALELMKTYYSLDKEFVQKWILKKDLVHSIWCKQYEPLLKTVEDDLSEEDRSCLDRWGAELDPFANELVSERAPDAAWGPVMLIGSGSPLLSSSTMNFEELISALNKNLYKIQSSEASTPSDMDRMVAALNDFKKTFAKQSLPRNYYLILEKMHIPHPHLLRIVLEVAGLQAYDLESIDSFLRLIALKKGDSPYIPLVGSEGTIFDSSWGNFDHSAARCLYNLFCKIRDAAGDVHFSTWASLAWDILKNRPEADSKDQGDPLNDAINSLTGKKLEAIFAYASLCKKNEVALPEDFLSIIDRFLEEAALSSQRAALFGISMPIIYSIDPQWAKRVQLALFPQESSQQLTPAWQTFVRFCEPHAVWMSSCRASFEATVARLPKERVHFMFPHNLASHIISYTFSSCNEALFYEDLLKKWLSTPKGGDRLAAAIGLLRWMIAPTITPDELSRVEILLKQFFATNGLCEREVDRFFVLLANHLHERWAIASKCYERLFVSEIIEAIDSRVVWGFIRGVNLDKEDAYFWQEIRMLLEPLFARIPPPVGCEEELRQILEKIEKRYPDTQLRNILCKHSASWRAN